MENVEVEIFAQLVIIFKYPRTYKIFKVKVLVSSRAIV